MTLLMSCLNEDYAYKSGQYLDKGKKYLIPECKDMDTLDKLKARIDELNPEWENAEIYGINMNGQITKANMITERLCDVVLGVMPKEASGGGGGKTEEEILGDMCESFLKDLPPDFDLEMALFKRPIEY